MDSSSCNLTSFFSISFGILCSLLLLHSYNLNLFSFVPDQWNSISSSLALQTNPRLDYSQHHLHGKHHNSTAKSTAHEIQVKGKGKRMRRVELELKGARVAHANGDTSIYRTAFAFQQSYREMEKRFKMDRGNDGELRIQAQNVQFDAPETVCERLHSCSEQQVSLLEPIVSSCPAMIGRQKHPGGYDVASPRIVEAIYSECVPVIMSDDYVLPFSDVLNCKAFSVYLPIFESIPLARYVEMQERLKQVRTHFEINEPPKPYDMIVHDIWLRRLNVQLSQHH
ncbi:hypothetical protein SUGI_1046280 [Cryptomeria japonica]|nr:hypothetical protein SUGI_1046280 [Cryptomeria japonica]